MNKLALVLIALNVSVLLLMPLASAQEPKTITIWTDKSVYTPGDTGTLNIAFYNFEGRTLLIKSIVIVYDAWQAYDPNDGWQGNQTINIGRAYVNKEFYYNTTKFTVPTDGRANSTSVHVIVRISDPPDIGAIEDYGYITVYQTPKYIEQVVTLFTILVVLIIVCTVILAATIFLSARRPRVTWKQNGE